MERYEIKLNPNFVVVNTNNIKWFDLQLLFKIVLLILENRKIISKFMRGIGMLDIGKSSTTESKCIKGSMQQNSAITRQHDHSNGEFLVCFSVI